MKQSLPQPQVFNTLVQVTIDIRLDPRLVPSGVRTAASGSDSEDSTSED
jgi:hypothetical protein